MVPLTVEFHSERDLYLAFMPFLNKGGVFVRTPRQYELGDNVELKILLPDALEESIVHGQVCWLTPIGAQNGTPPGVGINFVKDPDKVRYQIEQIIARQLNSSEPTLTM
ncbi:PilZ domain-containing protein [Colwellia ponticola]|uniref:Pilus assembly protein PilZ n=1 Tax=Colwellia ponticola TaxID=2304625 RepID=A0A8H2JJN0_9GAMM|nr:PilZ domain-containing protein [Colwellia ponticola]TMM43293.1 pilus assembly protein PilZ [Colwellia ponticola]